MPTLLNVIIDTHSSVLCVLNTLLYVMCCVYLMSYHYDDVFKIGECGGDIQEMLGQMKDGFIPLYFWSCSEPASLLLKIRNELELRDDVLKYHLLDVFTVKIDTIFDVLTKICGENCHHQCQNEGCSNWIPIQFVSCCSHKVNDINQPLD